jgi:parallel beta-helix repeat protein
MKPTYYFYLLPIILLTQLWASSGISTGDSVLNVDIVGPQTKNLDPDMYQHIRYVSYSTGSDETGDGSEESPWKSIISALLNISSESETNRYAILVASGTYDQGTIYMQEWIDLYGGFDPKSWDRDIVVNRSVLDGGGLRRVVIGQNNSRIDGFYITNGLSRSHGAGILCEDTSPVITNNTISNNVVLEPVNFKRNRIHQEGNHGGGIACLFNAVPIIKNNLITDNRTSVGTGAGIAFYGWLRLDGVPETRMEDNFMVDGLQPLVKNNVLLNNISGVNDYSRTRSSSGGAISCAHEARPVIQNNVIIGNEARGRSDAGGIYSEYYSYPHIEGNWILGNICDDDGGGFYTMKTGNPVLKNNIIAGNWTHGGGVGGIRISKEGRATIINNLIIYNPGGGVRSVDSFVKLVGNVILYNSGSEGVGYSNKFSYMNSSIIQDNIIRDNEKGAIGISAGEGPEPLISNNNVDDDWESKGENNYNRIPLFRERSIIGEAREIIYNQDTFITLVTLNDTAKTIKNINGKVIRVGNDWGVIKGYQNNIIHVWGLLKTSVRTSTGFEILPNYK